jgi:hypothetical protein
VRALVDLASRKKAPPTPIQTLSKVSRARANLSVAKAQGTEGRELGRGTPWPPAWSAERGSEENNITMPTKA